MSTNLHAIRIALAGLPDAELQTLTATANGVPQAAPGFLAWIEHITDWELRRRTGEGLDLQGPDTAIDRHEDAASIGAATMLCVLFARDAPPVSTLFGAIVETLTMRERAARSPIGTNREECTTGDPT